jgi:hypothetical protein
MRRVWFAIVVVACVGASQANAKKPPSRTNAATVLGANTQESTHSGRICVAMFAGFLAE